MELQLGNCSDSSDDYLRHFAINIYISHNHESDEWLPSDCHLI